MSVFEICGQSGVVILTFDNEEKINVNFKFKMSISVTSFKDESHNNDECETVSKHELHKQPRVDVGELDADNHNIQNLNAGISDSACMTLESINSAIHPFVDKNVNPQEILMAVSLEETSTLGHGVGGDANGDIMNKDGSQTDCQIVNESSQFDAPGHCLTAELNGNSDFNDSANNVGSDLLKQKSENFDLKKEIGSFIGLSCSICEKIFPTMEGMIHHGSADIAKQTCSVCQVICGSEANLLLHCSTFHGDSCEEICPKCPVCSALFLDYLEVVNHLKFKHTREDTYKCCVCLEVFQNYSIFQKHLDDFRINKVCDGAKQVRKRTNAQTNVSKTKDCAESLQFDINDCIKVVKVSEVKKKTQSKRAVQCKTESESKDNCKDRTKRTRRKGHQGDSEQSWHKCDFCERLFKDSRAFRIHTKPSTLVEVCKMCGAKANSRAEHLIHEYTKHSEEYNPVTTSSQRSKAAKCPVCRELFTPGDILNHVMLKHTNECPFICCVCDVPVESKESYDLHVQTHQTSPSIYKSDSCMNVFFSNLSFTFKQPSNEDVVKTVCRLCKEKFDTHKGLIHHYYQKGKERKACNVCEMATFTEAGYIVHRYLSHGLSPDEIQTLAIPSCYDTFNNNLWEEDKFGEWSNEGLPCVKCPCCPETVNTKDLFFHVMAMHTHESPFKCCACNNKSSSIDAHVDHCNFHLGKKVYDPDSAQCSRCNLRFVSRQAVTCHQGIWHRNFTCSLCQICFGNNTLLEEHTQSMHKDDAKSCSFCGKLFCDAVSLAWHERHHFYQKKTPCTICGEIMSSKRSLTHHVQSKHSDDTNQSRVLCTICGKMIGRTSVASHRASHFKERSHECSICKKTFKHRSKVLQHVSKVHMKHIKSFVCDVCGKSCTTRYNLKIHMRTHSSVKDFCCSFCGQGFNYNQSLQAHITRKHSGGP